jgi:uncharacterized protein
MKQILSFLTIGVQDLDKMKEFYKEKFGWSHLKDSGGIVFFKLNGIILGLYRSDELAEDVGVKDDGAGFKRFTLAINFNSEAEVDKAVEELRGKGVRVLKEPQKVFWGGYHSYVSDIEDNYWELAFNPFVTFDKDGNVDTHL